jgi:hypothetical protein
MSSLPLNPVMVHHLDRYLPAVPPVPVKTGKP